MKCAGLVGRLALHTAIDAHNDRAEGVDAVIVVKTERLVRLARIRPWKSLEISPSWAGSR
jgi:hypothetical protein